MMKTLVIVESPTKAKTITKFLNKDFVVESSFGHVRDLPASEMGVNTEDGSFEPKYIVARKKAPTVKKLKELAKKSDEIIFATDEDREGEAISWHLAKLLGVEPQDAKRIAFHEITKHAIDEALKNPRAIDQKLVDAQQARRILDRLVGYELSPLLWKKVAKGLSAGRVQSVAVRLIVEREREIKAFVPQEYWSVIGLFAPTSYVLSPISAELHSINGKKLDKLDLKTKEQIDNILADLKNAEYKISDIKKSEQKRTPPPPFTTSTLQQASNQKLGYSAKQTMRLAQQLYEGVELGSDGSVGLITYMRTDAVNLSEKFLTEARALIRKDFGDKYSLPKPRFYQNKSKGAQEAHEAIRPADASRTPESVASHLDPQQLKLYTLIWKRAVATQMSEAKLDKTTVDIVNLKSEVRSPKSAYTFRANGQTVAFDGWLKLYPESVKEEMLPELTINEPMDCKELKPEQHFTEPPARYSDATLVKIMEEYGIGRPSTYAPTIATIEDRGYVERDENKKLKPSDIAFVVNDLLVEHFKNIVDYQFTAEMEETLDKIAEGAVEWRPMIKNFYGPFHESIVAKSSELQKSATVGMHELGHDPTTNLPIFVRLGRFGPYAQLGEGGGDDKPRFAPFRPGQTLDTITLEDAVKLFTLPRDLGLSETGEKITVSTGRYGPYVKCGEKFYSLKNIDPFEITLEQALVVIKEKNEAEANKIIKTFPDSEIQILHGRYGPYITDGKKNGRIPKDTEPSSLELSQCQEILANAKEKRPRRGKTKK
ncbi:MAG: DNA topoisomerase I [Candidatus Magasanikbacteria bacterium RIFCSPLOWO2_01_FULL_43_20b]|uniref:DNA topoisomerase 1 n=1 Tax=Candidatus Magasanikbacteria bacterium RIFCSPLOWO2_12_FULL_43_12 TaxID=1798692 RepID=A0A1F6MW46_9BACT|nr:MAG: DNA topoisomerase I [Candidatus Magasanikbacteria bacterium RIFCSPHIGHO2_02_FULL_44_13]OGH72793.1 MAG: DNA topoisomerase I [Candidatus Magasanikbacteria bacterium RIFCSPLOWO2_01_FULL_43_20b]OGH75720.1 MAG: DNA topoisomerase I [Candidatus Magasanikbacteria bacterium RIFCSPLOWO2_12_FULL_43_12]